MANVKKKNNKAKALSKANKNIIIVALSAVVAICIATVVVFGFNLHLYGRDITVSLRPGDGATISKTEVVVEYGKEYTLPKPTKTGDEFAYWQIGGSQEGAGKKVSISGVWKIKGENGKVVLVAKWRSQVDDREWTGNY